MKEFRHPDWPNITTPGFQCFRGFTCKKEERSDYC